MAWNPAEGVRGPKLRPRKVTPWTDDEVRSFINPARDDRLHAVWRLSLLALRPEEVAGLRWDSEDLAAGTLTVARVQVIVAGKVIERETAKTPAGERTLPSTRARSGHYASCVGSSARNGLPPTRHISLVATAAT
jgi:integrase